MYEFGNNEQTAGRARALGAQLVKAADELAKSGTIEVDREKADLFYVLSGWWRVVNRSASAVWLLDDAGYTIESAPIARNLIEHTYSMAWLQDGGSAALTVVDLATQWARQKMIDNLQRTNWKIVRDIDIEALPTITPPAEGDPDHAVHKKLAGEFAKFDTLVVAYGRGDIYPVYRYLCNFAHATEYSANAYLKTDSDGTISLRDVAARAGYGDVIWTTASLIQAGAIISPLIHDDPLRRILRRAAAHLGMGTPELLRDKRKKPLQPTA